MPDPFILTSEDRQDRQPWEYLELEKIRKELSNRNLKENIDYKLVQTFEDFGQGLYGMHITIYCKSLTEGQFSTENAYDIYLPIPNKYGVIKDFKHPLFARKYQTHLYTNFAKDVPSNKGLYSVSEFYAGQFMDKADLIADAIASNDKHAFTNIIKKVHSRFTGNAIPILHTPGSQLSNWDVKLYGPISDVMSAIHAVRMASHKKDISTKFQVEKVRSLVGILNFMTPRKLRALQKINFKAGNLTVKDFSALEGLIFLDTETTGFTRLDKIWQLTAMRIKNGKVEMVNLVQDVDTSVGSSWWNSVVTVQMREGRSEAEAISIAKKLAKEIKGKNFDAQGAQTLAQWIKDGGYIVGSNIQFDINKLQESTDPALAPIREILRKSPIRTISIDGVAKSLFGLGVQAANLSKLQKMYNIPEEMIIKFLNMNFDLGGKNLIRHTATVDVATAMFVMAALIQDKRAQSNIKYLWNYFVADKDKNILKVIEQNLIEHGNPDIFNNDWNFILPILKRDIGNFAALYNYRFPGQIGGFDSSTFAYLLASINQDKLSRGIISFGHINVYDLMAIHVGAKWSKELRQLGNVIRTRFMNSAYAGSFRKFEKFMKKMANHPIEDWLTKGIGLKTFKQIFKYLPMFLPENHPMNKVNIFGAGFYHNTLMMLSRMDTLLDDAMIIGDSNYLRLGSPLDLSLIHI